MTLQKNKLWGNLANRDKKTIAKKKKKERKKEKGAGRGEEKGNWAEL